MSLGEFILKHKFIYSALCIFLVAFSFRVWNLNLAGQTWDERGLLEVSYPYTQLVKKLDFGHDYWWKVANDHTPLTRYVRSVASIKDISHYDDKGNPVYRYDLTYNRLLSVFATSIAALFVFLIGARFWSLYAGIAAGIIFSLLPIPLGHSQLGMYEPIALLYFSIATFCFLQFLNSPSKKTLLISGVAVGFACAARETHFMLYPMVFIAAGIKIFSTPAAQHRGLLIQVLGVLLVSLLTFFIIWPMPFFHLDYIIPLTIKIRATVHTAIPEVFFGTLREVPKTYYLVYVAITTPLLILISFLFGFLKIYKSKKWIWYVLILWFFFPFLMSFYKERQQGIRYIIQIVIPLSLIAGIGIESIAKRLSNKLYAHIGILALLFLYLFVILIRITPYYVDYFNILVGGAKGVYERKLFHLGWWGEGTREAFLYLNKNSAQNATIGIALSPSHILPPLPGRKLSLYEVGKSYDYVVVNFYQIVRLQQDMRDILENYTVVYSVMADGARIVDVYKRKTN